MPGFFEILTTWKYLTDWRIIAMISIMALLWLRIFLPSKYNWLWKNLRCNWKLVIPACFGVSILIIRGMVLIPFWWVTVTWDTLSPLWHVLLWGDKIHFRSIVFYSGLIILLWRRYKSLLPALAVGWFCIGVLELSFIFQHWINIPGRFIGWNWYIPFIGICLYFIIIHKCFRFPKKFWLLMAAATFVQYFLLLFYPYWILITVKETYGFIVNVSVLPTPPIQTWIFWVLCHLQKALTVFAFYQVIKVKDDVAK